MLDRLFNHPDFHGCMFVNAAMEFPNPHDPVHEAASSHNHRMSISGGCGGIREIVDIGAPVRPSSCDSYQDYIIQMWGCGYLSHRMNCSASQSVAKNPPQSVKVVAKMVED